MAKLKVGYLKRVLLARTREGLVSAELKARWTIVLTGSLRSGIAWLF